MKKTALCLTLFALTLGQAFAAPPHKKVPANRSTQVRPEQRFVPNAYIVELTGESAATSMSKSTAGIPASLVHSRETLLAQHRARVAQEQSAFRSALVGRGAEIHGSVDIVMNAMMVKYSGTRQDLESMPGVKHVYPVRRLQKHLDRAVGLTQVDKVWASIGGLANAGAGMKIGILDEGIDIVHPGFKDTGFTAPAGYPKYDTTADQAYTNNKVIVARSYSNMISLAVDGTADSDPTVQDHSGHGTALAMTSAGVTNTGLYGTITGVAPGAYLGVYRIWNTNDNTTTDAADIQAVNDAVADGMDVINMSFGSTYAPRFDQDPLVQAVEAAYAAGTMVISSAGNSGPYFTSLGSPATAPHAIAVGASSNDRVFGPAVWGPYVGTWGGWNVSSLGINTTACLNSSFICSWVLNTGDGSAPATPVTGPAVDAAAVGNQFGCNAFDSRVAGSIVFIERGSCTFATKVQNAQNAGAIAALVYDTQADTDQGNVVVMAVSPATLPAQSMDFYSANYILSQLAYTPFNLTMGFNLCGQTPCPFSTTPNYLTGFSSAGPGVDLSVKPEVVAPGENMSMATQTFDPNGDMYDATGYVVADGTSFSSPFTAGVYALIKSSRPGLTMDQYRSLVINTAKTIFDPNNYILSVNEAGAGLINALSAYQSPLAASPQTIGLGKTSTSSPQLSQSITLTNISAASDTFTLNTASLDGVLQPVLPSRTLTIGAGQSKTINVQFNGSNLTPGAYQGALVATSAATGVAVQIPYWLDVPSSNPSDYFLLYSATDSYRNQPLLDAFDFRLTDAAGAPMTSLTPIVTVVSGGGTVTAVNSADGPKANIAVDIQGGILQDIPGLWTVDVVLGAASGDNVFQVTAGTLSFQITITGCRTYSVFGQCLP